jgi:hypothetical protein
MIRFISWFAGKIAIYLLIVGLLLVIFLLKILPPMIVEYHEAELERAVAQLSESRALVGEYAEKVERLTKRINEGRQQLWELERKRQELDKFIQKVLNLFSKKELEAGQKRLEEAQQKLREEIGDMARERQEVRVQGGETKEEVARRELLRDEKVRELQNIQKLREAIDHLIHQHLMKLLLDALWILLVIVAVPFLWKLLAYYVLAPVVQNSNPIVLGQQDQAEGVIETTPSEPAQRLKMANGEVLLVRVDYLQGSMGEFHKSTKWLMDWRYPFSSMAAGLFILTRIKPVAETLGDVTLSTRDSATEELAVVDVPEGKALVFRPHFLVGLTHPEGHPPRIRTRWVFLKPHAWVNLQFRYLLIEGPTRLVFSAQRGIQVENVDSMATGRRVNSRLSVAFSPYLKYSPKRAETFVAYLWGKNALFDDYFQGSGLVIQQQVVGGRRNVVMRIWDGFFGAIGKVFGI